MVRIGAFHPEYYMAAMTTPEHSFEGALPQDRLTTPLFPLQNLQAMSSLALESDEEGGVSEGNELMDQTRFESL